MHMRPLLLLLLFLLPSVVQGQYLRLGQQKKAHNLYLDLDQLFRYNLYEHTRWGVGFYYAGEVGQPTKSHLAAHLYTAYGTADRRLKYGIGGSYRLANKHRTTLHAQYTHDLEHAATTYIDNYQLTRLAETGDFMSSRHSLVNRIEVGLSGYAHHRLHLALHCRHSVEQYLFLDTASLYPHTHDSLPYTTYHEALLQLQSHNTLKAQLTVGRTNQAHQQPYARLIVQYRKQVLNRKRFPPPVWYDLYAQAGITTAKTPYSRMFDISGTAYSWLFFNNALLTVPPNTFTANAYLKAQLRLNLSRPLWQGHHSTPRPFFQIGALWGTLYDAHALPTGHTTVNLVEEEVLSLMAPNQGLIEPAMGINELLHWNFCSIGLAAAYQIAPTTAPYHEPEPWRRVAVMTTLQLSIPNL